MQATPEPHQIAAFLMAAWRDLVGLEEAVEGLQGAENDAARDALVALSRQFSAEAETYGFLDIARLTESLSRLALAFPPADHPGTADALQLLKDTLNVVPMVLDNIAAEGSEDIPQLAGLQWRYDVEVPAAEALKRQSDEARAAGPVDLALQSERLADPEIVAFFIPEAREQLEGMARRLHELRHPGPQGFQTFPEALNDFFRHAHTLKGSAYTIGSPTVGNLAHALEEVWVAIRQGRQTLTAPILDASDRAAALIGQMVDRLDGVTGDHLQHTYQRSMAELQGLSIEPREPASPPAPKVSTPATQPIPTHRPRSTATADASPSPAASSALDPAPAAAASPGSLAAFSPLAAPDAPPVSVPPRSLAAPATPDTASSSRARSTLRVDLQRLERVLDLAGEVTVAHGQSVHQLSLLESIRHQLDECRGRLKSTVDVFQQRHLNPVLDLPTTAEPPGSAAPPGGREPRPVAEQFAELEFDRYDDFNILARRIGELSSDLSEIHSELEGVLISSRHSSLQVQNLTRRLRVGIGRVRMVPVGRLFARFSRLARKAAEEAGKEIHIEIDGEQVEVDNAVIDRVAEPLTHLVQNAIHHGIESVADRRAAGKPSRGTLHFSAQAKGRRVLLSVRDDGAGIDVRHLKQRAVELGLKTRREADRLSPEDALALIYLPGMTTARRATASAGRGVGMDSVRHSVSRLGGEVLATSELGVGTSFCLELPISLLVTEAMVVRVGSSTFALPLPQVKKVIHITRQNLRGEAPADTQQPIQEWVAFDGADWPVLRLADRLHLTSTGPVDDIPDLLGVAALVSTPRAAALMVDEIMGIEELVVKPLGPFLEGARFFSGATLDTRGGILLMLDVASLISDDYSPFLRKQSPVMELPETPPRILLVDDSLSVRRVLGRVLQRQGYEVFTARDGVEALELLLDLPFDGVITDLEMPRMSGYELIDDIRNRASTRDTPIWVVTTRAGARHAALARRLGAVGYLAKPVDPDLLISELESVLRAETSP